MNNIFNYKVSLLKIFRLSILPDPNIFFTELKIEIRKSYHPSYGCGYLDVRRSYLGYQRCYHELQGAICERKGIHFSPV